jgi:CHAD domain-containing protein
MHWLDCGSWPEVVDLLVGDGITSEEIRDSVRDSLLRHFEVRDDGEHETDRTFYDTFDGLVRDAGLAVIHEAGRLALVEQDSGLEKASLAAPKPSRPLLAVELEPGPLRDALAPIIDVRALLPVARVRSRERALRLLDAEQKTVVRVTLEQPAAVCSSDRVENLRPRLHLSAVRGYDKELHHARHNLEHALHSLAADRPVLDEAVSAIGGTPGGISSKIHVELSPEQPADGAATLILRRLLDVIEANLEGTIADIDTEFLHDFRVSVRRSRSVQRQLRRVFPPVELQHFRAEFRWLQQVTGDARDLDVYVLEFDQYRAMVPEEMRADLGPLLGVLSRRRLAARREMAIVLRSERATTLYSDWAAFLERLIALPEEDRPAAARPIAEVAAERIRRVYKRMVEMGRAIDHSSPPEDLHELRKLGKELRYLLELFAAPLFPSDVVKPMIRALKGLQDVLGRHQDREIQAATLRSLRDEVASLGSSAGALMAIGALVQRLHEDQLAARGEFAERFATFASKEQRAQVKEIFGAP